jgi:hypothetical protein
VNIRRIGLVFRSVLELWYIDKSLSADIVFRKFPREFWYIDKVAISTLRIPRLAVEYLSYPRNSQTKVNPIDAPAGPDILVRQLYILW